MKATGENFVTLKATKVKNGSYYFYEKDSDDSTFRRVDAGWYDYCVKKNQDIAEVMDRSDDGTITYMRYKYIPDKNLQKLLKTTVRLSCPKCDSIDTNEIRTSLLGRVLAFVTRTKDTHYCRSCKNQWFSSLSSKSMNF